MRAVPSPRFPPRDRGPAGPERAHRPGFHSSHLGSRALPVPRTPPWGQRAGRPCREEAGHLPHCLCAFRGDGRVLGHGCLSAVCAVGPPALASSSWKDVRRDLAEFPGSVLSTSCFLHPPSCLSQIPSVSPGNRDTEGQVSIVCVCVCVCGSPRTKALSSRGPCSGSPRGSLLLAGRCPGTDGKTRGLGGWTGEKEHLLLIPHHLC